MGRLLPPNTVLNRLARRSYDAVYVKSSEEFLNAAPSHVAHDFKHVDGMSRSTRSISVCVGLFVLVCDLIFGVSVL